jgi:hypothetical protein
VAPVHRPRFDAFVTAIDPRVRAAHREVRARLIDEDQPTRVDTGYPRAKRLARGADFGTIVFCGPGTLFLKT